MCTLSIVADRVKCKHNLLLLIKYVNFSYHAALFAELCEPVCVCRVDHNEINIFYSLSSIPAIFVHRFHGNDDAVIKERNMLGSAVNGWLLTLTFQLKRRQTVAMAREQRLNVSYLQCVNWQTQKYDGFAEGERIKR